MDIYDTHSYMEYAMDADMPKNLSTVSSYESVNNRTISKPRDLRLNELEEKLVTAEVRCTELRKQVAYMKMLYTSSHHIPSIKDDNEKKIENKASTSQIEQELRNGESISTMSLIEDDQNEDQAANIATNRQTNGALPGDPKDAMEWIVNEMTQSLNAMSSTSTFNIHSNTIERVAPSSKNKKATKKKMPQPEQSKHPPSPNKKNVKIHTRVKIKEEKSEIKRFSSLKMSKRKTSNSNRQQSVRVEKKKPPQKSKMSLKNVPRPQTSPKINQQVEGDNFMQWRAQTAVLIRQEPGNAGISMGQLPTRTNSTYLMPTLSYRMKCVPKNYTNQMTFRRIPFVVGKSTTKTHNLGSKIQETLSLIKLSRKGIPATTSSKTELNELLADAPTAESRSVSVGYNSGSGQNGDFSAPDCKNGQLRTVLLNLHDEFSRMNDEYEEMKATLKKENNPELVKKINAMEEVLNAKEAEIDVFMGLFNEVSELKEKLISGISNPLTMGRPATANNTTNETTPTLKLVRLLRRIENFQTQLKNTSYV